MDRRVNYTMVGTFVLLMTLLLLGIILWLTALKDTQDYRFYTVYAHEDVSGLSVASPVRFSGVKVGSVSEIGIDKKDVTQVRIVLKIDASTPVTDGTIATLITEGITGVQFIGLKAVSKQTRPLRRVAGERFPVIPYRQSLFVRISSMLDTVAGNINDLTNNVKQLVNADNRRATTDVLHNLVSITSEIQKSSKSWRSSIYSAEHLLRNAANASDALPATMEAVRQGAGAVANAATSVSGASKHLSASLLQTRILLHQTNTEVVPKLTQMLRGMHMMSSQVGQVAAKINKQPGVLLRGQQEAEPGPGEGE